MAQIRSRAQAEETADDQLLMRSAQGLNLAALTASDCGMPTLARQLCARQAQLFMNAGPFDADTAKLALQPLINLGRLRTRAGQAAAYDTFEGLFTAARAHSSTVIHGVEIDFALLTRSTRDRAEITRWLWTVLLTDGTRALASVGRWAEAAEHAQRYKAVGKRLFDGRQILTLAHSAAGHPDQALAVLEDSETVAPWEHAVASVLRVLCLSVAGGQSGSGVARMVERFLSVEDGASSFKARLGLCVIDLAQDHRDRRRVAEVLLRKAVESGDAYLARDILRHPGHSMWGGAQGVQALHALTREAALDQGALPQDHYADLMDSVRACEATLEKVL